MKKVIRILIIVALAFILKFYLFDFPRLAYNFKEIIHLQMERDSLQDERIYKLEKYNNTLVQQTKPNEK